MGPITIKSQGDRINIILDKNVTFSALAEAFREKVASASHFFDGVTSNIAFVGRELSRSEERHLLRVISTETTMNVTLVSGEEPPIVEPPLSAGPFSPPGEPVLRISRPRPIEPSWESVPPFLHDQDDEDIYEPRIATVVPPSLMHEEIETMYYRGNLRSGQTIKYDGCVVILGDANPGSEIVASGNVIVLGALKGMAHAGFPSDASCFVSALQLQPTQLRIANLITYVPAPERNRKDSQPSIAYVIDGQVFVGPM